MVSKPDYRVVFWIYILLFGLLTFPYWFNKEVIAPYRQFHEIAAPDLTGSTKVENRKFSDFTNGYIPEISEHLKGSRSGWLTLWTNKTELGRPAYQISGFSPAYLPSWVIAQLTDNPWRFITALSLFTCFFAGVFVMLFCREIGLHPFAGLVAGTSLAASPLFMYWLTFPMFPAAWCWSAGALWGVTRLARKPDLLGWSILVFSGYSLLMTAYPQPVVFHAYLLGGYGLLLAYRKQQFGQRETVRFVVLAASALVIGVALAAPVYRDLAIVSAESARVAPDFSFFTEVLPAFVTFAEVIRFIVLGTMPEIFGNPVAPVFPFSYDGLSVTPVVVFFAVIGSLAAFKKIWGWWLAIVVLCLFAFVHPLYVLGVKYLGFNLSQSTPLGTILLPLTVIVAYGADSLIRSAEPRKRSRLTMVAAGVVLAVIALGCGYGLTQRVPIRWGMVLIMLTLAGLLASQYRKNRPALLLAAIGIVLVSISYPLMLHQDLEHIATTSPLVEKVRENLPAGSRFAVAAPGIPVLPPNLNAGLGLASMHTANSLSPRRYQTLVKALGGEVQTYGRSNLSIAPDYSSAMFWMSNIGLMLSPAKLKDKNLEYLGEESGVHLHKVISRMGDSLQVFTSSQTTISVDDLHIADPRLLPTQTPLKLLDQGDLLEYRVTQGPPSVLVVSQKFHRDWRAQVLIQSGWVLAKTTMINGVFQGVLLPQNVQRVRLEFKPYARYAWVTHVFWLLLLVLLGFKTWQKKHHPDSEKASIK
jgi:hypothetical protein